MDHTLCRSEFLFSFFSNRKQVAFVKNTLSDEYVEIILGGKKKKNLIMNGNTFVCHWGKSMILLLQLLSQLWVISDPTCELRYPSGRSPADLAASPAETDPLSASADVQLI